VTSAPVSIFVSVFMLFWAGFLVLVGVGIFSHIIHDLYKTDWRGTTLEEWLHEGPVTVLWLIVFAVFGAGSLAAGLTIGREVIVGLFERMLLL